jgi:transcriptional regulator with XRE-family HTH domain
MASERSAVAKAFGAVLRKYRDEAGLTQEALANQCGLHATYISQLERGLKTPSLAVLVDLAGELGVRASVLVGEVERR